VNKYRFTINGNEVDNPEGWKNFELRLKRDDDIAGLLVSSTNKFTFSGSGYDALKTQFDQDYNTKANAKIYILEDGSYVEKYKGVIILTDVLFNLEKRTAQTTIEDANFQGAIQGNKNIKAFINSRITKNNEQTDALTVYNLDYFIANGTYQTLLNRRAYLLKDAIDFLVRFMTDDVVKGVQSAYLDDSTNFDGSLLYITTGEAIRVANSDAPNVSFVDIMTFLQRTHDLTFDFVTVSGEIVMRIEERAFFFQATNVDTFRELTDLTVNVDAQRIASHLEVGNNTSQDSGNCSATTRFYSFQKEDYGLTGKANIDKLIDLTTDFVTDSNVIQFIVVNLSNDTYDDDIVIVQASTTQASKFQSTDYCSNNKMYNVGFTNDNILSRMLGAVPSSIIKYLTSVSTPAKASKGTWDYEDEVNTYSGNSFYVTGYNNADYLNFTNIIYDDNNRYYSTPVTYYNVPFAGTYTFSTNIMFAFWFSIPWFRETIFYRAKPKWRIWMQHQDSSSGVKGTFYSDWDEWAWDVHIEDVRPFAQSVDTLSDKWYRSRSINKAFSCDTGDRIFVRFQFEVHEVKNPFGGGPNYMNKIFYEFINYHPDTPNVKQSWFECQGTPTGAGGGGVYQPFDPDTFKAKIYKFQKNVSLQRTDNIRNNTRSSVIINELSDTSLDKTVWIEEMVNNVETSETSFTMIN